MKTSSPSRSLAVGILLGITAVISTAIVYIDNVKHYWQFSGGFVRLVVSTNAQASITVDTNTLAIGFNTNASSIGFQVKGRQPATNATGNGASSAIAGVRIETGKGGGTFATTSATGGSGGPLTLVSGNGGDVPTATTNATGASAGAITITGGTGGMDAVVGAATNNVTGGSGASINVTAGTGASPATAATNAVGGAGGTLSLLGGNGGTPASGWSRKGGNGGGGSFVGGNGGSGTRTNGGDGGGFSFTAGNAGLTTSGGNSGAAGNLSFTGGTGAAGDTNSNGGSIFLTGGTPAASATAGDTVVGRTSAGVARGGLQVGPFLGGSVAITNILGASASLDFGSVAAGTVFDLPITVTGVTSNNVAVSLSVPWQSASGGGSFTTYNSNDSVYVRFVNNNLVTAIDPNPGTFTVVGFRIR